MRLLEARSQDQVLHLLELVLVCFDDQRSQYFFHHQHPVGNRHVRLQLLEGWTVEVLVLRAHLRCVYHIQHQHVLLHVWYWSWGHPHPGHDLLYVDILFQDGCDVLQGPEMDVFI